jgi:hypothetical protein
MHPCIIVQSHDSGMLPSRAYRLCVVLHLDAALAPNNYQECASPPYRLLVDPREEDIMSTRTSFQLRTLGLSLRLKLVEATCTCV